MKSRPKKVITSAVLAFQLSGVQPNVAAIHRTVQQVLGRRPTLEEFEEIEGEFFLLQKIHVARLNQLRDKFLRELGIRAKRRQKKESQQVKKS